jgi:endo-1,4-beta-xylanase
MRQAHSHPSRRAVLGLLAGAAALPGTALADAFGDTPSLGAIAAARNLLFGTAFDIEVLENPMLRGLYRHHARVLTTDGSMKFWSVRPEENETRFRPADRLVDFADAENIPIRGHTLVWNEWNPPWVSKLSASRCAYWMDRHIDEMVGRYAGRMQSWDVVNEPFWPDHGKPGGFRDGPWFAAMGKSYIRRAFLRAGQADKAVKLSLNEAGAEWDLKDSPIHKAGVLRLIDEIRDAGARIDIVGLECHWMSFIKHDPAKLAEFLGRLAEKKVEIYITELDVDDSKMPDDIAVRDQQVADRYAELLRVALREPAVKAVITWELADPASWYRDIYKAPWGSDRKPRPLPFDANGAPKRAYEAVAAALRARKQV